MGITRIPTQVPYNTYNFSDIFYEKEHPLTGADPDAFISQDLEGEPWRRHAREFDIEGREGSVRHIVQLIMAIHDENEYLRQREFYTGVHINHQEDGRLEPGQNGHEFYEVETDNNVRFVVSPLDDLVRIQDRIVSIRRLPNENAIFDEDDQFRSKRTPRLLARDHGYQDQLVEASVSDIRKDPRAGTLRTVFVDKYKNVLVWREGGVEAERERLRERMGRTIGVQFGDLPQEEVLVASSLKQGENGRFIVYPNGKNIDFAGKWGPNYTLADKRANSAYEKAGRPVENVTSVQFEW